MGRIRTVKPELFTHDELFDAEVELGLPLRIAFIGLFTVADREGRFKWRPRQLKLHVLPYDNLEFSHVLDALTTRGFLVKYEIEGVTYGCITNFSNHQVINNRESDSSIPAPLDMGSTTSQPSETHTQTTSEARVDDASATPTVHAQGEGKGKEGKGKGRGKEQEQEQDYSREREVFEYWQNIFKHTRATFDEKKRKKITARLKEGYPVAELKLAIDGCKGSAHHQGQNEANTIYDSIDLIFRDDDHVRQFVRYTQRPQAATNVSRITQKNQAACAEAEHLLFGEEA